MAESTESTVKEIFARITHKHDTEANWTAATDFVPLPGELIVYDKNATDPNARLKIGNGIDKADDLPFITDVLEYTTTDFPTTGVVGKIYVDTTTNLLYRWNGAEFKTLSPQVQGLTLGTGENDAFRGDYGNTAYTHSQQPHAPSDAEKNVQSDWTEADTTSDAFILNKPAIPGNITDIKLGKEIKTYYNIGKVTNASESNPVTIGTATQTIGDLFDNLFVATAETPTTTAPSLTLSLSNNSANIEYGAAVTFTATITANTGRLNSSYYSGGYTTDTGVSWSALNLVSTNSTFTSKTSGITSGTSFTVTPSTTYYAIASGGTIKGKATAPSGYTSSGKVAKNNLGNDTDVKISSSTSAKESSEDSTSVVAGYTPYTYTLASSLPASLPTYNRSKDKPSSITVSGGNANTYLYIFVPSSSSISSIKSGGFGVPTTLVESSKSYIVNNGNSTTFKVYKTDSTVVGNTFNIT